MSDQIPQNDRWTVGRLLTWTTQWFEQRDVEGGRLAAELLLARAMDCAKIELYTRYDQEPSEQERTAFRDLVRRAGEHTPIAYLLESREFYSLDFKVTSAVLVPRPETEAVVHRTIDLCRGEPDREWTILDIGTGTGCIAISIAKFASNATVTAVDVSPEALAVAADNIARHEIADRVRLIEADCAALPAEAMPEGGFDLIVSNPPYVSEAEWSDLPPHIREHEPKIALVAPAEDHDSDGLSFYRRLAVDAPALLAKSGRVLIEIGHNQHDGVRDIFLETGQWEYLGVHRDPTDPHQRVIELAVRG
jgi:release factor glutamine methyltransferase